jgi:hypothetical protein
VDDVGISRIGGAAFLVLTGSPRANKMLIVPPGEAAHFISAARIFAARRRFRASP